MVFQDKIIVFSFLIHIFIFLFTMRKVCKNTNVKLKLIVTHINNRVAIFCRTETWYVKYLLTVVGVNNLWAHMGGVRSFLETVQIMINVWWISCLGRRSSGWSRVRSLWHLGKHTYGRGQLLSFHFVSCTHICVCTHTHTHI